MRNDRFNKQNQLMWSSIPCAYQLFSGGRLQRDDLRLERADLWPQRDDLRPKRAELRPQEA